MRRTPSIVVVDDDELDARLIEKSLRGMGFNHGIHHCRDGAEALEYFARSTQSHPMLVVLDIRMPRIDGVEVLRRLKSDARWLHLPVMMLTTSEDQRTIAQCYELGCMGCVRKPADLDGFTETVRVIGRFAELLWAGEQRRADV